MSAMDTRYILGAYWGPRRESVDDCARRLSRFMHDLCDCDPALATWFAKGYSRQKALKSVVDAKDPEVARSLLDRGRNRRDTDGGAIEALGFGVSFWNGAEKNKVAGLSVNCGLFAQPSRGYLGNSVVLSLPMDLGELFWAERMAHVVAATALAWEPDWAGVMSEHAMDTRPFSGREPFLDWLLYVPKKIAVPESLASVLQVKELGSIVLTRLTAPTTGESDAAHLERIGAVLQPSA